MQLLGLALILGVSYADVLNTKSGPIQGTNGLVEGINAFLGIPFAEPPVGALRFKNPVPISPWNTTYNATRIAPPCAQLTLDYEFYYMPDITNMSEDCLYLNLWSPKSNSSHDLRPILIFIHGGGFFSGATNFKYYDGSNLAKRGDMVVATISYRLGVLGFFSDGTKNAPGNMGMLDQVMAMKWIKDNAKIFGGDPESITLMGNSAGSFSISIHMVSPLSQRLFKRAILQSGTALHPNMFDNSYTRKNSKNAAAILKCINATVTMENDIQSVLECLRNKSMEEIVEADKRMSSGNGMSFYPSIDDDFLPKSAKDLFREGKFDKEKDVLIGITRNEGALILTSAVPEYFGLYGVNNARMTEKLARFIARAQTVFMKDRNSPKTINYYFNQLKNKNSTELTRMLVNIIGDYFVACGTIFLADILSMKGNSVYFYKFEFRATSTPMAEWVGVTHMDEIQYIFGNPFHKNFTSEEIELSNRMMDRWCTFARKGNPNIPNHLPWLRYNYQNKWYLSFGQEEESIRMDPLRRCEIWRETFNAELDPPLIRFLRNSGFGSSLVNEDI